MNNIRCLTTIMKIIGSNSSFPAKMDFLLKLKARVFAYEWRFNSELKGAMFTPGTCGVEYLPDSTVTLISLFWFLFRGVPC